MYCNLVMCGGPMYCKLVMCGGPMYCTLVMCGGKNNRETKLYVCLF